MSRESDARAIERALMYKVHRTATTSPPHASSKTTQHTSGENPWKNPSSWIFGKSRKIPTCSERIENQAVQTQDENDVYAKVHIS